jgi:hypothetical protein
MRGAPQSGFSVLICRINPRSSVSIGGRPPNGRKISACNLSGAFQQIAHERSLPELIPILFRPTETVNQRRRRIADPTGNNDICASGQCFNDRTRAQMRVG